MQETQVCQEPAWGIPPMAKIMRKEAQQNTKAWSGFGGSPWVFLNIYPPKPESACFITVLFTLLTFSGKKWIQGSSLLHQFKPLWWLTCPIVGDFYKLVNCLRPPTSRGTKLKASWRYRAFSKKLKIILVMGFHCWVNDCCQASIFFIF